MPAVASKTAKRRKQTRRLLSRALDRVNAKVQKSTASKSYSGPPVEATRLFSRQMKGFKLNDAAMLMAVNDHSGTVTYLNTYHGGELPASFNAKFYTFKTSEKKLAAKIEQMEEIEASEWPTFVVPATRARRGKDRR